MINGAYLDYTQKGKKTTRRVEPYLDKVLVDPFGEGFLLHPVSLICKGGQIKRGLGKDFKKKERESEI